MKSSGFVVAENGHMFPRTVIFPVSFGVFRVPNRYVVLLLEGAMFHEMLNIQA